MAVIHKKKDWQNDEYMHNSDLIFNRMMFYNKEKENRYSILIKAAERTALPLRSAPRFGERGGSMVTYSDLFTFVIMICAIITLVRSVRNDTYDKTKK